MAIQQQKHRDVSIPTYKSQFYINIQNHSFKPNILSYDTTTRLYSQYLLFNFVSATAVYIEEVYISCFMQVLHHQVV